jgi:hypothetical protein
MTLPVALTLPLVLMLPVAVINPAVETLPPIKLPVAETVVPRIKVALTLATTNYIATW